MKTVYICQNCEQQWEKRELRLTSGETTAAGACPDCGMPCHEGTAAERSVNLPAAEVVAQLRSHRTQIFAEFFEDRWPPDVSDTCDAAEAGTDCVELKLPEDQYCICCQTYAAICREWYAKPEIRERMRA